MSDVSSPEDRLRAIVRTDEDLMAILAIARGLRLPQWRLVAGCLYQTVWNHLTGRPRGTGIKDYDLIYFDGSDGSWQAEDAVIQRGASAFGGRWPVEIRNQARVHLWFQKRFGLPYPRLASADESLSHYVSIVHAVGVRLEEDGRLDVAAPFGLDDVFGMIIRANPSRIGDRSHHEKAMRARMTWPEVTIMPPAAPQVRSAAHRPIA